MIFSCIFLKAFSCILSLIIMMIIISNYYHYYQYFYYLPAVDMFPGEFKY